VKREVEAEKGRWGGYEEDEGDVVEE